MTGDNLILELTIIENFNSKSLGECEERREREEREERDDQTLLEIDILSDSKEQTLAGLFCII